MNKKVILLIGIISILSICFISAFQIITTFEGKTSFSVSGTGNFVYKINIENTDIGNDPGINKVEIILPSSLKFVGETNITDSIYQNFSGAENILEWNNYENSLIAENEKKYFGFTANTTEIGEFSISIKVSNSSGEYAYGIAVDVAPLSCIQNWSCTEWSECLGESKIRTCVDFNLCGNESERPIETENCFAVCVPVYSCGEWTPEKCKKEEIQTRVCADIKNCGTGEGRPTEERVCKANSKLLFIIMVIVILTFVALFTWTLIDLIRRMKNSD